MNAAADVVVLDRNVDLIQTMAAWLPTGHEIFHLPYSGRGGVVGFVSKIWIGLTS